MRLNPDCVRDILITIEEYPEPMNLSLNTFSEKLPMYTITEICYCCIKLYEANYINLDFNNFSQLSASVLESINNSSDLKIKSIRDLTFLGHEFLENIKNDNNWNKTKNIATKVGSFSFDVISKIAINIISQLIKQQLM